MPSLLAQALKERRYSILGWIAGTLALGSLVVAIYPTIRDSEPFQELLRRAPRGIMALVGIDPRIITTGIGFVQAQLYTVVAPVVALSFAIQAGASATASEEESGTADLLFSLPVQRYRVILARFAALALLTLAIVAALALTLLIGNATVDLGLPLEGIIGVTLSLWLLAIFHGALAMVVGGWRGRRTVAGGVTVAFAFASFFLQGLAPLVGWLRPLARLTPFHWYHAGNPVKDGAGSGAATLAIATLAMLALAVVAFQRRDLRTSPPRRRRRGATGAQLRGARQNGSRQDGSQRDGSRQDGSRQHGSQWAGWWRAGWWRAGAVPSRAPRSVYAFALWDRRWSMLGWMGGLIAVGGLTIAFWPTLRDQPALLAGMIESMPKEVFAAFGIRDPAVMMTPQGFLSSRLYATVGPLLMLIFAIGMGTASVAGEERRGTMDLLLSAPLSRRRVLLEKFGALATLVAALAAALLVVVWIGDRVLDLRLPLAGIVAANTGLALLALLFGTLAFAVGCATGKAGLARGIAAAAALGGFLFNALGSAVESLGPLRVLSPFCWFLDGQPPLARGFTWGTPLLLLGIGLLLLMALAGFRRRDIRHG